MRRGQSRFGILKFQTAFIAFGFRRGQRRLGLPEVRATLVNHGNIVREASAQARVLARDQIERGLQRTAFIISPSQFLPDCTKLILQLEDLLFRSQVQRGQRIVPRNKSRFRRSAPKLRTIRCPLVHLIGIAIGFSIASAEVQTSRRLPPSRLLSSGEYRDLLFRVHDSQMLGLIAATVLLSCLAR